MKNIKVIRNGTKTTVIYERKNKPVKIYYNDKLYAKVDINKRAKKIKKDRTERNVIAGMIIFFIAVIAGGFFFEDTTAIKEAEAKEIPKPIVIEKIVKVKDDTIPPILLKIAKAESGNRHFDSQGNVVKGKVNNKDIGKFQLNETVWGKKAKELGYDIYTEKGNEQMALWIFEHYGSVPWKFSAYGKNGWINK